jgi:phosphoribosylanthranilate isomerase
VEAQSVKICGLTTPEAVIACGETGCGFAGFIAHPLSPRHLTPERYADLIRRLPPTTRSVLVTVDADDAILDNYIHAAAPTLLQLHGNESPDRCREIATRFHLPIIKAFGIATARDLHATTLYHDTVTMLLLDSKRADGSSGGVGAAFDWSALQDFFSPLPWFLSGGIGLSNIDFAMRDINPPFIDVSSHLEFTKGIKDPHKIRHFMNHISAL